MTLADIRDWLKTLNVGEHFYVGKIDNKKDKSIGVYDRQTGGGAEIAIGGLEATKTAVKHISVLIHWNNNASETEAKAQYLYNSLLCLKDVTIGDKHVDYIYLATPAPVDVGSDDKGIYERVIWLDIYYKKG